MPAEFIPKLQSYDVEVVIVTGGNPKNGETGFRQLKAVVRREEAPFAVIDVKSIGCVGTGVLAPKKDGDILAVMKTKGSETPFIATISRSGFNGMKLTIEEITS